MLKDLNNDEVDIETKAVAEYFSFSPFTLNTGYADMFHRDRAPTQFELLTHLTGVAYRCATLNANLVASTRLRLYVKTRPGQRKPKFVEAAQVFKGYPVTQPVPEARLRDLKQAGAVGKSALLDATEGGADRVEEVTDHPILDLLRKPENALSDGGLSSFDFRQMTIMHLETLGRSYWYVSQVNQAGPYRVPARLVLLRSQLVREFPDMTGQRYIDYFQYGTNTNFRPEDVIRFTYPDPANPHLGFLSPMRAAIEKVRLARGGDAFVNALLKNGGYPAGLISPKDETGIIGDKAAERLRSAFRSATSEGNAGKVVVFGSNAVQLQTLAWKPAEIIDLDMAKEIAGQIADTFDVPRTKLWRNESNRASAESGDISHARDAGLPRCTRVEETLNAQLVPLFDDSGRLFLAFDSPVDEDKQATLEEVKAASAASMITVNEGRQRLGYEPTKDPIGDCRVLPKGAAFVAPDGKVLADSADPTMAPKGARVLAKSGGTSRGEILDRLLSEGYSLKELADMPEVHHADCQL